MVPVKKGVAMLVAEKTLNNWDGLWLMLLLSRRCPSFAPLPPPRSQEHVPGRYFSHLVLHGDRPPGVFPNHLQELLQI